MGIVSLAFSQFHFFLLQESRGRHHLALLRGRCHLAFVGRRVALVERSVVGGERTLLLAFRVVVLEVLLRVLTR